MQERYQKRWAGFVAAVGNRKARATDGNRLSVSSGKNFLRDRKNTGLTSNQAAGRETESENARTDVESVLMTSANGAAIENRICGGHLPRNGADA